MSSKFHVGSARRNPRALVALALLAPLAVPSLAAGAPEAVVPRVRRLVDKAAAHHRGTSDVRLSGDISVRLSRGCHTVQLGNGAPLQLDVGGRARSTTHLEARAVLRDGQLQPRQATTKSELSGVAVANPTEAAHGILFGASGGGLKARILRRIRRGVDGRVSFAPSKMEAQLESGGGVRTGISGTVDAGRLGSYPVGLQHSLSRPEVRRWLAKRFPGGFDARTERQLLDAVGKLAPAERALLTGLVDAEISANGKATAQLRAGRHQLKIGQAEGCVIEIARGGKAEVELSVGAKTSADSITAGRARVDLAFEQPVTVRDPLNALPAGRTAESDEGRGLKGKLGGWLRRLGNRVVTVSLRRIGLERDPAATGTRVTVAGSARVLGLFNVPLERTVTVSDQQVLQSIGRPSETVARLAEMIGSAEGDFTAKLAPRADGADGAELSARVRPVLTVEDGTFDLQSPVDIETPSLEGTLQTHVRHTPGE